ncbi:potassium transport system protein kup [Acrasis kona]|uniref:Potassium transport system protein kup n=1 Tax=Acrasis kona TaxID=1008807 RepID=A0AAW2ZPH3_9EUKA
MAGGGMEEEMDEATLAATLPRRRVEQGFLISMFLFVVLCILIVIYVLFMVESKDNWYAWPLWVSILLFISLFFTCVVSFVRLKVYLVEKPNNEPYPHDEDSINLETYRGDERYHSDEEYNTNYNPPAFMTGDRR